MFGSLSKTKTGSTADNGIGTKFSKEVDTDKSDDEHEGIFGWKASGETEILNGTSLIEEEAEEGHEEDGVQDSGGHRGKEWGDITLLIDQT